MLQERTQNTFFLVIFSYFVISFTDKKLCLANAENACENNHKTP